MDLIKEELGKRLTVEEVATIFGVDERLVRQHYNELGGMRLGNRVYVFFEKEVINAVQRHNKHEKSVDRANQDQRKEGETSLRHTKRSTRVGGKRKKPAAQQSSGADPHGILAGMGDSVS